MYIKRLKKVTRLFTIALVALSAGAQAQDQLASMAPIDRKMRAIDSVSIVRLMQQEEVYQMPASALYPSWNNEYIRNYGVALPKEYRIDLRGFHMPTDSRLVTSHFGYRPRFRRQHYGTDIKVYVGDTIRAAFDGKVRVVKYEGKGYGKYVIIRHPNGLETLYGHTEDYKNGVYAKTTITVKAGEPIGLGGNTGRSYGSHLHFETRFLGHFIDPEKVFDFAAQDVLGDFYMFRSSGAGTILAAHDIVGGEEEMSPEQAAQLAAQEKQEESRAFQEERKAEVQARPRAQIHKVKKGESLYTIAKKHGVTVDKLCRMNNISKRTTLRPGQILKYS